MEEKFLKLQDITILKDIRSAVDSVGVFNIALAALIFVYANLSQFISIDEKFTEMVEFSYLIAVVAIGAMLIIRMISVLDKKENDAMNKTVFFSSLLWLYPLTKSRLMVTYFPIISIMAAIINVKIAQKIPEINIEFKKFPPAVANYFNNVLPIVMMAFLALLPYAIYYFVLDYLIFALIYILSVLSHSLTMFLIIFLICYFWYKGFHGVGVISMLFRPFWFQMIIVNAYTFLTNQTIPYIVNEAFLSWAVWIGGSGGTIGLMIAMRLFARSEEMKNLGKEVVFSSLSNINENVVFGTPIVNNKYMKIPFFLAPMLMGITTYTLIFEGYLPHFSLVAPWVLPGPVGAFFSSGGSFKMMGFSLVLILISTLVYLPFFIKHDRQLLKEEATLNE